ncbi:MMPL family transporter [bacterium]|nr:MMPL family transporter [bacterium]MBU1990159.1 MMPL family transporter [bacterium]
MLNWRIQVEKKFEKFSNFIIKHRFKTLFLTLILIAASASHLPKITFDTSTEGFLYKDDPQIIKYDSFRNQFGRDEKIIVAIQTKDIFDADFLKKLFSLHKELEEKLPYIKEVNSLKNARKTLGNKEELIVEDLFENAQHFTQKDLEAIKKYASQNLIYENLYLNKELTITSIMINTNTYSSKNAEEFNPLLDGFSEDETETDTSKFISVEETNELIEKMQPILQKYKSENFIIYEAGSPIVTKNLQEYLVADMSKFIFYIILTISLLLFVMFKRISGILIPLLIVVLTLFSTIGLMAYFGFAITSMTQILPSLILAVAIGASIHILSIFYHQYDKTQDKNGSISFALSHSGLAVLMTSLTTAASLLSFSISEIAPVAALGLFSALGVMLALVLTLVLIPILLSIVPIKPRELQKENILDKVMMRIADFSIHHYKSISFGSFVFIFLSLLLASQIHFSHNPLHWFKEDNHVRINTQTIDKELRGSISIEVVLDTKKTNGVYNPEFLNSLERVTGEIYTFKGENYFIGKIVSINDVLKEIHMALNENRQEFYAIPQNRDLIAQEFLLFENSGSDDLEEIVDSQFSKTRLSIKAPWVDSVEYVAMIQRLESLLNKEFGSMADVYVTGTLPILSTTITKSIQSSIESYILAFGVIAVLLILLISSIKLGLLSMLPNLTPIMFGVAFMVYFDLPLDMFTILIGAIAIGMVVDDTIHYMHNFKRYYLIHQDADEAIRLTLHSTGRAIFITSIVLSCGFLVFMFAQMTNLFNFGLITGVVVLVAMFTNLVLTGSLIKLFYNK